MTWVLSGVAAMPVIASFSPAMAKKTCGAGIADVDIKIGQSVTYSGPAVACSVFPRAQIPCFKMGNGNMSNDKGCRRYSPCL